MLKRILRCFELSSRLKIIYTKSMLVGIGCPDKVIQLSGGMLHGKSGKQSMLYFSLPIGLSGDGKLGSYYGKS